jgi:hypothetical protein
MKTNRVVKFRPLRLLSDSKIAVASYMSWRNIWTSDYHNLHLIVSEEYKSFDKDLLVHNHKGEPLFWYSYNPEDIPTLNEYALIDGERPPYPPMWKTHYGMYCAKGLDVDGVPYFSYITKDYIINSRQSVNDFQPLTVEIITWWFGWFLWQLNNPSLTRIKTIHD